MFIGSQTSLQCPYPLASVFFEEPNDDIFAFYVAKLCFSVLDARVIRTSFYFGPTSEVEPLTYREVCLAILESEGRSNLY